MATRGHHLTKYPLGQPSFRATTTKAHSPHIHLPGEKQPFGEELARGGKESIKRPPTKMDFKKKTKRPLKRWVRTDGSAWTRLVLSWGGGNRHIHTYTPQDTQWTAFGRRRTELEELNDGEMRQYGLGSPSLSGPAGPHIAARPPSPPVIWQRQASPAPTFSAPRPPGKLILNAAHHTAHHPTPSYEHVRARVCMHM